MRAGLRTALLAGQPWRFSRLFAAGEPGLILDPASLQRMYQDANGQTPAAFDAQVGLIMDASRPAQLLNVEKCINPGGPFVGTNATAEVGAVRTLAGGAIIATAQDGSADRVEWSVTGLTVGRLYCVQVDAEAGVGVDQAIALPTFGTLASAVRITTRRTYSFLIPAAATNGLLRIYAAQSGGSGGAAGDTVIVYSVSVKELTGNHAYQIAPASRPTLRQAGGLPYLEFDGLDDWMQTGPLDLGASGRFCIFTALRKESDATLSAVLELSSNGYTNTGNFGLYAPSTANNANYGLRSRGTVDQLFTATPYAAPHTAVISALGDIAADMALLRVNGKFFASAEDQGAGALGANYPLFIGRRGGSSLTFGGRLHALIIRGGLPTDAEIAAAERDLSARSGVRF